MQKEESTMRDSQFSLIIRKTKKNERQTHKVRGNIQKTERGIKWIKNSNKTEDRRKEIQHKIQTKNEKEEKFRRKTERKKNEQHEWRNQDLQTDKI